MSDDYPFEKGGFPSCGGDGSARCPDDLGDKEQMNHLCHSKEKGNREEYSSTLFDLDDFYSRKPKVEIPENVREHYPKKRKLTKKERRGEYRRDMPKKSVKEIGQKMTQAIKDQRESKTRG